MLCFFFFKRAFRRKDLDLLRVCHLVDIAYSLLIVRGYYHTCFVETRRSFVDSLRDYCLCRIHTHIHTYLVFFISKSQYKNKDAFYELPIIEAYYNAQEAASQTLYSRTTSYLEMRVFNCGSNCVPVRSYLSY